tara:strand:+ start:16043 stop:16933 length:891 start_codon:yes stop_codon:yes gene_type:complete
MTATDKLRCAFLVMESPGDFVMDHDLAIKPLEALGWSVDCVPWRDPGIRWREYDAVYICTPWDYIEHPDEFLRVLSAIDRSRPVLVNDLALVQWTLEKSYLRDLAARGAAIVPSTWYRDFDEEYASEFFAEHNAKRLVIKPLIGANATDTFVLQKPLSGQLLSDLAETFRERAFFVQPYIESIETEGEYSLFYFAGEYSHAIQKVPKSGDFRVQEEHGANIRSIEPAAALVAAADKILAMVSPSPVYARADFVHDEERGYLLMELELIEPSLYLRTCAEAPERFARAFDRYVREQA